MIKAVIIEPKHHYKSFSPYFRNDRYMSMLYNIPIINNEFQKYWNEPIERIILSYAAYWGDFKIINEFIKRHTESKIFWITNEYNLNLNSAVSTTLANSRDFTIVANYVKPKSKDKRWANFYQVNLNALIFQAEKLPPLSRKKYNAIYYGMFRPDRGDYFKKYFDDYSMIVSTSPKNIINFKQIDVKAKFIKPFFWSTKGCILQLFKFSLYIEDIFTHSHYNYPANRFYEALTFGIVQLFDINCLNTFKTAGYDISDYIVTDGKSMRGKIAEINKNYAHHLKKQMLWRRKAAVEKRHITAKLGEILLAS